MLSATARTNIRAVHNFFALRAVPTGKPRAPQQIRAGVKVSTGLLFPTAGGAVLARARRPVRSFSTSSLCPFQKRPMKPVYRASSMCRKTRTAEIQSGTPNGSTSELSRYSLSETQAARKTQRICPMEQYNLAKCAALPPFDCSRLSLKKRTRTGTILVEAGTLPLDMIGRAANFTGMRRAGAAGAEGWTYAAGDGIEVTVTFSETVKVEWRPSSAAIATTGSRSTTGCAACRAWP